MRYKRLLSLFIFLLLLFIFNACNPRILDEIEFSELYGTYIAKYPYAKETLIIYPNGQFTQDITIFGKTKMKQILTNEIVYFDKDQYTKSTGQWKCFGSTQYIIFDNYLRVAHSFGDFDKQYTTPGRSILPPERGFFGGISIIINDDLGYEYKKVK